MIIVIIKFRIIYKTLNDRVTLKEMDFAALYLCLFVGVLCEFGKSQITCGHLKVVYDYRENSIDSRIRLYPSNELQTVIVDQHLYRWILTPNASVSTSPKIILQKNTGSYDKTKYNEENFTLLIRNLTASDVGKYEVECWTSNNVFYNSDKVKVNLPERPTNTPGPKPSSSTLTAETIGSVTVIVMSICVVVIVAIICGTIYLIFIKQRGGIRGITRLVSDEGTSALGHVRHVNNEDPLSIYNEIDTGEMILDYAKVEKMHVKPVQKQIKNKSAAINSSDNGVGMETGEDAYDLMNINNALVGETDNMEVEYADIILQLPNENVKSIDAEDKTTDFNYAKVAANKIQENADETIITVRESTKPRVFHEAKDVDIYTNAKANDTQGHTYAKVSKKRAVSTDNNKIETQSLSDTEYSVQFPDINYSEITRSLDDINFDQKAAPNLREPATYSNLVPRSQKDKARASRASRRELQYAVLDLPDHDSASFLDKDQQFKGHAKLQTCTYDDVDFERKAFVAPVRKAPSSWYKRKNKEGKHRNC